MRKISFKIFSLVKPIYVYTTFAVMPEPRRYYDMNDRSVITEARKSNITESENGKSQKPQRYASSSKYANRKSLEAKMW